MSNNEEFDYNIKEQFEDYSPQVHPRIWENIVKKREKKRPVGFWLTFFNGRNILLLSGLFLSAGTGAYLLLRTPSSKTEKTNTAVKQNTATVASNTGNSNKTNTNPEITTNQTTAQSISLPLKNAEVNTTDNNSSNTISSTDSKIKTYAPSANNPESYIVSNYAIKKKNKSALNNDYDITDADLKYTNQIFGDNNAKRLLFADVQIISAEKKALYLNKRLLPNIFLPDCPSIEKNAAGNKTYVEVYAGPDIAFRSLGDTGNSAYLQKRKESTKFSSAYSAGIRYTRVFNNGVSVRTGINYSQINEKFTFVQGNLVQVTYILDANGDTTGSYITTGTRYKTTINRYRTIDVPLLFGYEMGNGKFHANINAGIIVNVYSWQKGDVLDTSYKPVSITTGKTSSAYQFKTNIGIGFMAGGSFYYKLNEKTHILAEPYFRYNLAPMSKEKLTLTQKYNSAGLRLGLRVDLH